MSQQLLSRYFAASSSSSAPEKRKREEDDFESASGKKARIEGGAVLSLVSEDEGEDEGEDEVDCSESKELLKDRLNALDAGLKEKGVENVDFESFVEEEIDEEKLTPLEKQWKSIKKEHPDVLIVMECGYKFRMYQQDAAVAAKVLGLGSFKMKNFLQASFPTHRLHVHVKRLVEHGHLVGVVSQTETAALKKQSQTRNKLFDRSLKALYSRATFLRDSTLDLPAQASSTGERRKQKESLEEWTKSTSSSSSSNMILVNMNAVEEQDDNETDERWLFSVQETKSDKKTFLGEGWHLGEPQPEAAEVYFGLVAVNPASGRVSVEGFLDDPARSKLRQRMEALNPVEVILQGPTMSAETELIFGNENNSGRRVMRTQMTSSKAESTLEEIYHTSNLSKDLQDLDLPKKYALASAAEYLMRFGLQKALLPPHGLSLAKSTEFMEIDANALRDLEIIGDPKKNRKYSLIHFIVRYTQTPMGRRRVHEMICKPLVRSKAIKKRQEAVAALVANEEGKFNGLFELARNLKGVDLDRSMERVLHARCAPAEFLQLIDQVESCANSLLSSKLQDTKLASFVPDSACVQNLIAALKQFKAGISREKTLTNSVGEMFVDAQKFKDVFAIRSEMELLSSKFKTELQNIRKVLKKPDVKYRTLRTGFSSTLEYLIELPKGTPVPRDWNNVSATQHVVRYTTPVVEDLLEQLARRREELITTSKEAWRAVLEEFANDQRESISKLSAALGEVDAFLAFAAVSSLPHFCKPDIEDEGDGGAFLELSDARHPLLETLSAGTVDCVPNDVVIGHSPEVSRVHLVTGPNMAGKSSFCRLACISVILAQIGCFVPAKKCRIRPFDAIRVRMGVRDDPLQGMSTFLVEMKQAAAILNNATERTLCVFDELGRGTSTHDGTALALASLRYVCKKLTCSCFFITHFTELAKILEEFEKSVVKATHLKYVHDDESGDVVFLYQVADGLASNSYGLHVAKLAGIPEAILNRAKKQ